MLAAATGPSKIAACLLGTMGLRSAELRAVRVSDLNMDAANPTLLVRGAKFGKVEVMALDRIAWSVLLPIVTGAKPNDPVYPRSRSSLAYDLIRACRAAGVPQVSPHDLRRTCARVALEAGAPLTAVKTKLRHSQISTTAIYVGDDPTAVRRLDEAVTARLAPLMR